MKITFKAGTHPKGKKDLSKDKSFELMPVPEKVYIPLAQHIGAPATCVVQKGDSVKVGSLIGQAKGFVSANIFSSVSGTVEGIVKREGVFGLKIDHIVINNDGEYTEDFLPPLENPDKEQIVNRVKEAGIVGMGGATFPTHVKLSPKNPIRSLLINGAECEPYITTDFRLMLEKPKEILQGIILLKKALNAEEVYIGIEDNKPEAIASINEANDNPEIKIVPLKTKYPQGGEKQLIYSILHLEVPEGGLPSDIACVVDNVATCYAVYEAVCLGKPLFGRYMTVSGGAVGTTKNLYVRTGIPFEEIAKFCDVSLEKTKKVVSGGPMMGIAQPTLRPTVTKGSSSLLFLTDEELAESPPSPCINCARCANACPIHLMPMLIDAYVQKGDFVAAKKYSPYSCMECGCCSFVCPAKRPLVQSVKLAKKIIKEKKL